MTTTIREQIHCGRCGSEVLYDVVLKGQIFNVKGEEVQITSRIARCKNCKTELDHPALKKDNRHRAFDKYRENKKDENSNGKGDVDE